MKDAPKTTVFATATGWMSAQTYFEISDDGRSGNGRLVRLVMRQDGTDCGALEFHGDMELTELADALWAFSGRRPPSVGSGYDDPRAVGSSVTIGKCPPDLYDTAKTAMEVVRLRKEVWLMSNKQASLSASPSRTETRLEAIDPDYRTVVGRLKTYKAPVESP